MFDLILDISKYSLINEYQFTKINPILVCKQCQCITDDNMYVSLLVHNDTVIGIETVNEDIIIDIKWFKSLDIDQIVNLVNKMPYGFRLGTFNIIKTSQAPPAWQELIK